MKPDDIPQWAWEEVGAEFFCVMNDAHSWGSIENMPKEFGPILQVRFAHMVSKARSQAYEECAKLIEDDMYTDQDIEDEPTDFRAAYNRALKRQARRIRSRKETHE